MLRNPYRLCRYELVKCCMQASPVPAEGLFPFSNSLQMSVGVDAM